MSVNPSYIPGSLRNIEPADGNVTGFRFACRLENPYNTLLYSIHRMTVFVDGIEVTGSNLRVMYNGASVAVANLPHTNWIGLRGELIEIEADLPGGLATGSHEVRLEALFGGGFSCGMATTPVVLCHFTAESA